jgi:NADPH-dependent 2,4-dienoyl-CoA reductase/sulfur reductase-like enzyme/rhodanese-related sulfurtransferase/nitrogen-specific signal transduction histidine kinase
MSEKEPRDDRPEEGPETGAERQELLQLASIVAHQLKSPLNTIQTVLSTVVGGFLGPLDPRQRRLLEQAAQSCSSSMKLVSDLLRLRSLDDFGPEQLVPVNLVNVLGEVVERYGDAARQKSLHVATRVEIPDPAQAYSRGQPDLVGEVIGVLLDNAIKYTPREGRVDVRIGLAGPEDDPHGLCVEVIDTGIGIPPEDYEKLFTEFFRAGNARAAGAGGTGLGLAFAARAARLMGGQVRLEPAPTGGVRAALELPLCPDCAALAAADGEQAPTMPWMLRDRADAGRDISQRVVIIGGVAAGSKAAAKVMRLDPAADVTMIERGRAMAYAGCGLPYYITGAVGDQSDLTGTPLGEERDSSLSHELQNVHTLNMTEALEIDRERKRVRVRRLIDGAEDALPYDRLVLATGASAVVPEMPGRHLDGVYTLHGVHDAEAIKRELSSASAKDVVVIGAGRLGCYIVGALAMSGARISLVESRPHILGFVDPELGMLVRRHLEANGVKVVTGDSAVALAGEQRVEGVQLASGRRLACDFTLVATGWEPNVELAREAGLELGSSGAIRTDRTLRTSDPEIFAVGDCAETFHRITGQPVWNPTGSAAVKQARCAAINVCGGQEEFPGVVGSIVMKVFDYTVGRTGFGEQEARELGYDPVVALVPSLDSAHYIPTAKPLLLKLVADRSSRLLLGAQGVGEGRIAKRLDIVATALSAGMTVDQFSLLDLGFAPPFGLALDSLLAAANVIRNKLDGLFVGVSSAELREQLGGADAPLVVDVRLPAAFGEARLENAVNLPLNSLRGRLHELPRDRDIVIVSRTGLKSYEAALILADRGFARVAILDGGLASWPYALDRD